jgi:hypothetical protein
MSIQHLAPPTIDEVEHALRALETQYGITTPAFIEVEGRVPNVDEDDAVEWDYLVEQLRCLREVEVKFSYSRIKGETTLMNNDSVMDRLALAA